jgi:CRP/FNR family transcriptional regulator
MNGKQPWPKPGVFSTGIFAALSEEEWRTSAGFPPPTVYERKTALFLEGRPAEYVYVVGDGLVKTFKKPPQGRVQIVGILGAGDVVGAEALVEDEYHQSATVLTRSLAFKFEKRLILELFKTRSEVALTFIQTVIQEYAILRSLMCDLGTKKALARVASCLLFIKDKQLATRENPTFNLPISRQEMGELVGLSPETISRQLRQLTASRVIKLAHKRLTILDLSRLRAIAQV